jgi:hypothetical protein
MKPLPFLFLCAALPLQAADPDFAGGKYGKIISTKALVKVSSTSSYDSPENHLNLVRGPVVPCAFHTNKEKNPHVLLKLPAPAEIKGLEILNRGDGSGFRSATLTVSVSENGSDWKEIWSAGNKAEDRWAITCVDAGGRGHKAAWVKLETKPEKADYFHLSRVTLYGN